MDREIKFRAFCKSENRMLSYEHLKEATKGMVDVTNAMIEKRCIRVTKPSPYGLFLPLEDEDLEFMQFTGLYDKNGKEIYEGDIVKDKNNAYDTFVVKYGFTEINCCGCCYPYHDYIGFYFENIKKGWVDMYDEITKNLKVIGNIYDNPELLKGE